MRMHPECSLTEALVTLSHGYLRGVKLLTPGLLLRSRAAVQTAKLGVPRLRPGEHDHGLPVGPTGGAGGTRHLPLLQHLVQGFILSVCVCACVCVFIGLLFKPMMQHFPRSWDCLFLFLFLSQS